MTISDPWAGLVRTGGAHSHRGWGVLLATDLAACAVAAATTSVRTAAVVWAVACVVWLALGLYSRRSTVSLLGDVPALTLGVTAGAAVTALLGRGPWTVSLRAAAVLLAVALATRSVRYAVIRRQRLDRRVERWLDVVVAGVALVLLAPVVTAVALAVRCELGPNVLVRQQRVGRGGRRFELLRFRSAPHRSLHDERHWTAPEEVPPGPVGRFIRAHSLDDIPQLYNVLAGDLTLVGPQPRSRAE